MMNVNPLLPQPKHCMKEPWDAKMTVTLPVSNGYMPL